MNNDKAQQGVKSSINEGNVYSDHSVLTFNY